MRRVVIESDQIDRSRLTIDVDAVVIPVDASKIERIVENLLANTALAWACRPSSGSCSSIHSSRVPMPRSTHQVWGSA